MGDGVSGQIFGFSSASMLIPQALMGVASVALVYAMATRVSGRTAGLIAGTALALTPVAAMMFRYNNPDAAMVLLMTTAAYCTVRALPRASMKWLILAGVALGFAFLAKMLEGLMILPALGLVYLVAAPTTWGRRFGHLLAAAGAMVVSAGWFVLLTILWPASSRPYLAGSTDNSFMNLVLGYNGLARIEGREGGAGMGGQHGGMRAGGMGTGGMDALTQHGATGAGGGGGRFGGGRGMFGSSPGITRLFTGEFGAEISFLLPSALIASVLLLVLRGRRRRTDLIRATTLLFGIWLIVDGLVLSFMNGTTHPYYSLAIAPPIAGLIGVGAVQLWRAREDTDAVRAGTGRCGLAAMVLAGGIWGFVILDHAPSWQPWLRWLVLVAAIASAIALMIPAWSRRRIAVIAAGVGLVALISAPAAYAINGDTVAHTGGGPSVLPTSSSTHTGAGGWGGGAGGRTGSAAGGQSGTRMGGFENQAAPAQLTAMLRGSSARWAAAVTSANAASGIELAAKVPVMAIGGFSGSDPTPTLAQFQRYVADKQIGYYLVVGTGNSIGGATPGGPRGERRSGVGTAISEWVTSTYHGVRVGNYTVYDLS
ncbi:ArnT family glycosyltransferase [Gordonia sp. NPDC003504]